MLLSLIDLPFKLDKDNFNIFIIISFILSTLSSLLWFYNSKSNPPKPLPSKLAQNNKRKPGHWIPEDYKFPKPQPYPNWNIYDSDPIAYRPFKHKYNVTMGIRNMNPEEWIEIDNKWLEFHELKKQRLQTKGKDLYGTLPIAYDASLELLDELKNYLPERYPSMFKYNSTTGVLSNLITGEDWGTFDLKTKEIDPMFIITNLLQDDIAIMIELEDGQYYLKAGAIVLPGFWRLTDKLNMPLSEIHTSGDVPKYNTHLKKSMEKFFTRLKPETSVLRNNYFIQTDKHLDWSSSIGKESEQGVGWYTAPVATDINQIYYRSERQSLRKLPKTGAVVFTIRTYFIPIIEIVDEPYVPLRLLNGLTSWSNDVREYKGFNKFKDVLLPYLEGKAKEQEVLGYTRENEKDNFPL
ncbi:hypothetical protein BN7_5026 [Wickerhamomyces ciferrii]|uniref:Uncharacterized protein n=1 Tax=Wickerhamomyces ciferrii (strain ATCC 14091 / BCRC 22168 / CBS 111 / JCM 3599 / NBRC 0793 / NRRL Y-1031 F-60-10) TaxID=1206466 RepID=K0KVG5_WICCF|nr:uncharacterized protein BN7_5026 [Wickerhamomyces ciferrii]CCH45444.1 hypothetical protein BN7_5026 [Wickerhamomyces ciferrii]